MTAWYDARMTVLDLETTGVDPEEARIVTAAVGYVGGGQTTDLVTLVAAVDVEIPEEAAAIHGFTTERARREGIPPPDVLDIICGYLERRPLGSALVDFNARFDLTMLDRELRRFDDAYLLDELLVVDPLIVDRWLDKYRPGKRNLATTAAHYRVALEAAHQAGADAITAARLAWRLGRSGHPVRRQVRNDAEWAELEQMVEEWARIRDNLPALHAAQARWAAEAAADLEAYFHKGNPKKDVPPQPDRFVAREWPIVPYGDPPPYFQGATPGRR